MNNLIWSRGAALEDELYCLRIAEIEKGMTRELVRVCKPRNIYKD